MSFYPFPLLFNYNTNIAYNKKLSTSFLKKSFLFSDLVGVGWENNLDPVFQDGALICVAIFLRSAVQPFLSLLTSTIATNIIRTGWTHIMLTVAITSTTSTLANRPQPKYHSYIRAMATQAITQFNKCSSI